jgi:hypothetical protein
MEDSSRSALRQSLGQLLGSIEGLFFVPSGASTLSMENLDQLRITLGPHSIRFRCASDGETLSIDGSELCPKDLGEYGTLRRADLSQTPRFGVFVNMPLRQFFLVKSHGGQYTIGLFLVFGSCSLLICNWGDELKVWDSVPEALFADEGIQVVPA